MGSAETNEICFWKYSCIVLLLAAEVYSFSYIGNHDKAKRKSTSCLQVVSECRKNSACNLAYRNVKKECSKSSSNKCFLSREEMLQCADDIDWLKTEAFGETCACSGYGMNFRKIKSCAVVYNMLFANPCYDHGVKAREDDVFTTVSISTAVDLDMNDVTVALKRISSAEQVLNYDNRVIVKLDSHLPIRPNQNGLEPEHTSSSSLLDEFADDIISKQPEIVDELLSVDREAMTLNGREQFLLAEPRSALSETHVKKEPNGGTLKKVHNSNESSFKIKILKEELTSNDISNGFRDKQPEKNAGISDPNAEEVARVVAKFMGDHSMEERTFNSTVSDIPKKRGSPESVTRKSASHIVRSENLNNTISLVVLVVSSLSLSLFLLAIVGAFCYRRWKTKGYISKRLVKKTCHHSTIIVSSLYDSRDARLKKRLTDV